MKYLVSYTKTFGAEEHIVNDIVDWDCISEENIRKFESPSYFGANNGKTIIAITKIDKAYIQEIN